MKRKRSKNKNKILTIGAASVAALLAAVFARDFIAGGQQKPQPVAQVQKQPKVHVLAATTNLPMGARLRQDVLQWQEWPEDNVLPGMIVREQDENAMEELAKARVRVPLVANEPIMDSKIIRKGEGGLLSTLLHKGMRAIAVKVTVESGAGGFIMPNDRVDVLLTRSVDDQTFSDVVLENVRVLAINQTSAADKTNKSAEAELRTATLEVTPLQAKVLARVQSQGELSLVLRSLAEREDGDLADDKPRLSPAFARTGGGNIHLYRYGKFGVQAAQN